MILFWIYFGIFIEILVCILLVLSLKKCTKKTIEINQQIKANYREITCEIRFCGEKIDILCKSFDEKFIPKEMSEDDFIQLSDEIIEDIFKTMSLGGGIKKRFLNWIILFRILKYKHKIQLSLKKSSLF
ncbi:MAG: hypothetical protein PHV68_00790 [Candidatus Gastranaerophilales bacterium]|nr:hypothetical protein [Candidatus Gastranaerophilales bacterium]